MIAQFVWPHQMIQKMYCFCCFFQAHNSITKSHHQPQSSAQTAVQPSRRLGGQLFLGIVALCSFHHIQLLMCRMQSPWNISLAHTGPSVAMAEWVSVFNIRYLQMQCSHPAVCNTSCHQVLPIHGRANCWWFIKWPSSSLKLNPATRKLPAEAFKRAHTCSKIAN